MNIAEFNLNLNQYATVSTHIIGNHNDIHMNGSNPFLNIFHMNIRSISKNFDNLLILLESLKDCDFDIIILSETWRINLIECFNIKGYNIFYSNGSHNQNDGLVIYIKNIFNAAFKTIRYTENTFTTIQLKKNNISVNLIAVYRLPSTNLLNFIQDLQHILELSKDNESVHFLIGDININIQKQDEISNEYLNIMAEHGFCSYINTPTRVEKNSQSCLDHCFLKIPLNKKDSFNITPILLTNDITDHFPILLNISYKTKLDNKPALPDLKTNYNIKYEKLELLLKNETWQDVYLSQDVNVAYDTFINNLSGKIQQSTAMISLKTAEKKLKPWITKGLINSIRKRDKMKFELNKNKNNVELFQKYKIYRNKTNNLIKISKKDYYFKKINENKHDIKKIWRVVRESLNENINTNNTLNIKHNTVNLTDEKEISETFNNYFINVGKTMTENIKCDEILEKRNINCKNIFLKPITEEEIIKNLDRLKNNSSPGIDNISTKTLKAIKYYIVKPLCHIFNLSIVNGIFPDQLKTSVITPIYKNGDRSVISNYRPISVLNNIAKILERCMKSRLIEHLIYNKILSDRQFGFVEGKSTEDAIFEVAKTVYNSFENNKKMIAIFLDLAKAFDTVSHSKLLNKLELYGIRGIAKSLFTSYLSERKQCVRINNSISKFDIVKCGIPQGTVLGPILFNIYLNELLHMKTSAKTIAYADDTVLLIEGDSWEMAINKSQLEISKIVQWLSENSLSVNITKTKFMCFSIYNRDIPNISTLKVHNFVCSSENNINCNCKNELHSVKNIKYLGVCIDQNLRWEKHIELLNSNIRKLIWKFYQLRSFMPFNILKTLYYALAESIMRYGISIWGSAYPTNLKHINISQKHLLKVIAHKNKLYPTESLFREIDVFDINLLYIKSVLVFVHKRKPLLTTDIKHNHNTRQKTNLNVQIPCHSLTTTQRFITYYGPKFYNLLPPHFKQYNNINLFSKKINIYIKENKLIFINVLSHY